MITRKVNLTIKNNKSKPDSKIYLYRKDRGVILNITLIDNPYTLDSTFAGAVIVPPTKEPVTIPKEQVQDSIISLHIEAAILDQLEEVGEHLCHIHLFDLENNRVTVPAFSIYVEDTAGDMDEEYEIEDLTEGRIALATSITNLGEPTAPSDALEKMASNIDKAKEDIDATHELEMETMEDEYLAQMGAMEEEHLQIIEDINNQHMAEMGELQTELETEIANTRAGKEFLATSITSKGVETAPTDSFETMAGNIDSIEVSSPTGVLANRFYFTADMSAPDTTTNNPYYKLYLWFKDFDGEIKRLEMRAYETNIPNKYPNGDQMKTIGNVDSDGEFYGTGYYLPAFDPTSLCYAQYRTDTEIGRTRAGMYVTYPYPMDIVKVEMIITKSYYKGGSGKFTFKMSKEIWNSLPNYKEAIQLGEIELLSTDTDAEKKEIWTAPNYTEPHLPTTLEYDEKEANMIQEQIEHFKHNIINANKAIENLHALI